MEVSRTDIGKAICYLEGAAKLYEAIAAANSQSANCRAHMIRQLINKLNTKLQNDKK